MQLEHFEKTNKKMQLKNTLVVLETMWEKNYFLLFCQGSGEAGARDEEAEICVGKGETEGEKGVVMKKHKKEHLLIYKCLVIRVAKASIMGEVF